MLKDLIGKILKKTKKVVTLPAIRTSSGEFLLKKTDFGIVRVEFSVIQKIAERATEQVKEIHDAEIAVEKSANVIIPIRIQLTTALKEGYSAPRASEAADRAINDTLRELLGFEFYVPVDVKVKQIKQIIVPKRRVR